MQTENQTSKIKPADRLASVSEYYFSKKLKEVAQMNAEGKDVISLGIGSPDMPPSEATIQTLCREAQNPDGHGYMPYVGIPELRRSFAAWYKKWYGVELTAENKKQFYIPEGFAHGFLVRSETAEFCYKVTDYWHPDDEGGIMWNDPDIGIDWGDISGVILSEKDKVHPLLKDCKFAFGEKKQ